MIRGREVSLFIRRLEERHASLYHACQLRDFRSYLAVGGVPSRQLLERRRLRFTGFASDQRDKEKQVWNKVFLNLQDYGKLFDHGQVAVPNPYGPILIRLAPEVLGWAENVAVCMRSAGGKGFHRKSEALTLAETELVFQSPASAKIKPRWDLREEFENARSPELSCQVRGQVLPFVGPDGCLVEEIKVDPCDTGHARLDEAVCELFGQFDIDAPLVVRMGKKGYRAHYRNVVKGLRAVRRTHSDRDIDAALSSLTVSEDDRTRRWARKVQSTPKIRRQFKRFASYLVEGTLGRRNAS